MAELSPMMKQYLRIKEENPNSILFFRLGDFYEMFFEDAKIASKELELTLTGRDCGLEERAPMCGVPYHSCEAYISRLVAKGYKVAICEQTEDPATAKGIVNREIIRVITPGTVIEDCMLDESRNNFLCAVCHREKSIGICFVDGSTGELDVTEFEDENPVLRISNELGRFLPSEVLLSPPLGNNMELLSFITDRIGSSCECLTEKSFDVQNSEHIVLSHFKKSSLGELNLAPGSAAVCAIGAALSYLYETQRAGLDCISSINKYSDAQYMQLDISTRRNLELIRTMRTRDKKGSLLWVMDKTYTAMGKRLLTSWIEQPLLSVAGIVSRQNGVDELFKNSVLRGDISEALDGIYDLERLMTRVMFGTVNPRELKSLSQTLGKMPSLKKLVCECKSNILSQIAEDIDPLKDVHSLIESAIDDKAPFSLKDGGVIRKGFNDEIDQLRIDMTDSKGVIARMEERERQKTGIKTLKIRYNKIFGYYIEVSNSYKDLVPKDYIRKQTLTNCERFITEELKHTESRVLGAKERLAILEHEIFSKVRTQVGEQLHRIQTTAAAVARLDTLCSFATVAAEYNFVCPSINMSGKIEITGGRHPVVERLNNMPFVPNDTLLDNDENRCAVITGPNMAGKSTYMRQVAIITLLAQIGSFVPAQTANISICDAIFTRVGASDDLSTGRSTFMVEMSEVAYILQNATKNSLIIFDEIGRGTSTFDGMSIARAVLEFVLNKKRIGAKTLFATHYHELTVLEDQLDGIKNYNTAVKKHGDNITFLRRIVRGGTDDSYGIEVAKLAGIPDEVIKLSRKILNDLESGSKSYVPQSNAHPQTQPDTQLSLSGSENEIIQKLKQIDANTLSPIEALTCLYELTEKAKEY